MLEKFPDVTGYIDELIIMGGGFDVFNMPHNAEYNFSCDPAAVKKVLACPVDKTLAPLDMTHKLAFSQGEIGEMTKKTPAAAAAPSLQKRAGDILSELFYLNYETSVKNGNEGAIIHDAATIAYLLDKNKCGIKRYNISSDEYGAVKKDLSGYSVNVIENIDRDFIKDMFKDIFKGVFSYE
jgi:inosine-uridine nucleoside N-ribohydrolase